MRKRWWICLVVVLAGWLGVRWSLARPPQDSDWFSRWRIGSDATIGWSAGEETLAVGVDVVPEDGDEWVMAVPADAGAVKVGWAEKLPEYGGWTPTAALYRRLSGVMWASSATQGYPAVWWLMMPSLGQSAEVRVPEPSQRGFVYELCGAKTVDALRAAVDAAGITLWTGEWERLAAMVDGRHSFLLVHATRPASSPATEKGKPSPAAIFDICESPCLEVRFPSSKPIMPMRAIGQGTGFDGISNICVLGYVELEHALPAAGGQGLVRHYRGTRVGGAWDEPVAAYSRLMYHGVPVEVGFVPQTGWAFRRIDQGYWLVASPVALVVLWVVWTGACSWASGWVAGRLVMGEGRKYARLGLWNLGTILLLRYQFLKGDKSVVPGRRALFLAAFSVNFVVVTLVVSWVVKVVMGVHSY